MISESKRAQIIDALKANPNASAVARQYGVSHPTVRGMAKAAKIDLGRSGPKKVTPEKRARIIKALEVNPNASAVAREIGGISYAATARLAKKANIALAQQGRPRGQRRDLERVTDRQSATTIGTSQSPQMSEASGFAQAFRPQDSQL
jgi:transposase-like protein